MPAEQFKSTLTKHVGVNFWIVQVQGFLQNCAKTLHFKKNHILILFKIRRQSMDTDGQNKGFDP